LYVSAFEPYSKVADVLINGMFWDIRAPKLFKIFDMHKGSFNIKIIGDITCDIAPDSSIPCTFKATSLENPVFGYLPVREKVTEPFIKKGIDIMAVPNLPNELPRDASIDFSHHLTEKIIPLLFEDKDDIIKGATICKKGKLTDEYMYLESFVFDDNFRLTI
jgi:alanine dehydrogenase